MTTRRLAAILAADVVGSSRLIEADEGYALTTIREVLHDVLVGTAASHGGRLMKTMGDGALLEFASPVDAVTCATVVQSVLAERAASEPEERRVLLRIGVNLGDVVAQTDGDLYGDGVNIAARLESIASPGGIAISGKVYEELQGKVSLVFEDRGEQSLKNVARPVRVYALGGSALDAKAIGKPLPLPDKPSIAVLPFTNMSADAEQEFFAEGVTEDIITELSRINAFFVIARNSTFTYKGRAVDVKQVGQELGVRYVVEGSVRRMGDRVRITAQLIEAATGAHVWADRFDRNLAELFDVQDEVIRSIVASMQTQVVINEGARAEHAAKPELEVWELAKRGWKNLYGLTLESIEEAGRLGRKIIELDARSAKGHQLVAAANFHLVFMGFAHDPEKLTAEALGGAQEATRLDRRDEYSFWVLGMVLGTLLGRSDEGIAAYRQALDINPNFSVAYGSIGTTLAVAGRADESFEYTKMAMRLNPRDPSFFFRYTTLSLAHFAKWEFDEARQWADRAVARKPDWWLGHALLAASRECIGDHVGSCDAVRALLRLLPQVGVSRLPFQVIRDQRVRDVFLNSLRVAGLPE